MALDRRRLLHLDNLFTGEPVAGVLRLSVESDPADAIRFGVRKGIDYDRIDDAENRDGGTDSESKRKAGRQCEVRVLFKLTDAITKILNERVHESVIPPRFLAETETSLL